MRAIKYIIIHCSDSKFGNAIMIDKWHRDRGFDNIGYHYVILNGSDTLSITDGTIEIGRAIEKLGAHAKGYNTISIGICLIGPPVTVKQLESARMLCLALMDKFGLGYDQIIGHYEVNHNKECPCMKMDVFREFIERGRSKEVSILTNKPE